MVAEYQTAAALKRELLYRLAVEAFMEQKCGSHMVFAHDASVGNFFAKSLDKFAPIVHIHNLNFRFIAFKAFRVFSYCSELAPQFRGRKGWRTNAVHQEF